MRIATISAFARGSVAVIVARVWLRVAPGPALRWSSSPRTIAPGVDRSDPTDRLVWGVNAAGHVIRATCLERSMALTMLLAAARVPARLVVGVDPAGRNLRAHAWVESRGRVVLGAAEASDYAPLPIVVP